MAVFVMGFHKVAMEGRDFDRLLMVALSELLIIILSGCDMTYSAIVPLQVSAVELRDRAMK